MTTGSKKTRKYYYPRTSISLGQQEQHDRRLARIDEIARELGTNRSGLMQLIADGEILLIRDGLVAGGRRSTSTPPE